MIANQRTHTADMGIHFFSLQFLLVVIIFGLVSETNAIVYQERLDIEDMELLFGEDGCIDGGTISVSEINPVVHSVVYEESLLKSAETEKSKNEVTKSPLMLINELATFNKIPFEYLLTKEEGPAHSKQFTVSLKLGEEEYIDEGSSIKNAKCNVAKWAVKTTQYNHPPLKPVIAQTNKINKNPVQKLEELVSKDTTIKYTFKTKNILESFENHENNYHENMYLDPTVHEVTVNIGHLSFIGEGLTSDSAKQQAAYNALTKLKVNDAFCSIKNVHGIIGHDGNKCPISLINKFALKSSLKVNFDCTDEEGPAHMKVFTIKCKVGKFESVGKGTSKKNAKNEAALNMLKELESYAYTNDVHCNNIFEKDKNKQKQKANKIEKSKTFVSSGRNPIPGDDINPVSKLMEIQQQSYNKHPPIFTLLEENGAQNNQFSIQVKVGDLLYVGYGPNKKVAKRKAAEGMLQMLRYSGYKATKDPLFVEKSKELSGKPKTNIRKPLTKSGLYLNLDNFETTPIKAKPSMVIEDNKGKGSSIIGKQSTITKSKTKSSNFKSPTLQLEKISKSMGFRFQFSDFPKNDSTGFVSLLSLTTEPPKVCFDTGVTPAIAQDNVARKALAYLRSHLDSMSENVKKLTLVDVTKDWFQLDDMTGQEETITEL